MKTVSCRCMLYMTFFLFMILAACNNESPLWGGESGICRISLRLSPTTFPSNADNGTRTTEDGSGIENRIYSEDTKVCIFGDDNILQSIVYDGEVNNSASWIDGNGVCLDINLELEKFRDGSIRKIVIVSNIEGFADASVFELKEGTTLDEVRNISLTLPMNQTAIDRIPMYGEKTLAYSDIQNNGEVNVSMNRMLAKIEVVDELKDNGYEIESVLLAGNAADAVVNTSTEDVVFASDGKTFRAYVPKRELGENVKSENRRITMNIKKSGSETTEQYNIYLSRYDGNGEPVQDESEAWKTLLPNHLYRFTVTSIEPSLQVQDKIKVIWYYNNGINCESKFRSRYIVIGESFDELDSTEPVFCRDNASYMCTLEIPSSLTSIGYKNIAYCFVNEDNKYEPVSSKGYIWKDAVKIENEGEYTCFYLNAEMLSIKYSKYPTDRPYRFYCRNEHYESVRINKRVADGNVYFPGPEYNVYGSFSKDDRGYGFIQIEFKNTDVLDELNFGYSIKKDTGDDYIEGSYMMDDIFEQEIDGEIYYVFYLD